MPESYARTAPFPGGYFQAGPGSAGKLRPEDAPPLQASSRHTPRPRGPVGGLSGEFGLNLGPDIDGDGHGSPLQSKFSFPIAQPPYPAVCAGVNRFLQHNAIIMLYVLSTSRINAGNLRTDFPEGIAIREMTPSNARCFRCLPHSNDARISKCPALRPTDPLACKPAGSIFGNSLQPQTSLHTRTALATAGIWLFGRPGQPLYCDLARRLQDVSTYTISSASVEYSADNCRPSRTAIPLGGKLTTAIAAVLEVEARPQF